MHDIRPPVVFRSEKPFHLFHPRDLFCKIFCKNLEILCVFSESETETAVLACDGKGRMNPVVQDDIIFFDAVPEVFLSVRRFHDSIQKTCKQRDAAVGGKFSDSGNIHGKIDSPERFAERTEKIKIFFAFPMFSVNPGFHAAPGNSLILLNLMHKRIFMSITPPGKRQEYSIVSSVFNRRAI